MHLHLRELKEESMACSWNILQRVCSVSIIQAKATADHRNPVHSKTYVHDTVKLIDK